MSDARWLPLTVMDGAGRIGPPEDHLVESEVDGHISLYDPVTGRVHVLNSTASDTWRLSDGTFTADQIVALMARAYQSDAEEIRLPVEVTLGFFCQEGLIRQPDETAW